MVFKVFFFLIFNRVLKCWVDFEWRVEFWIRAEVLLRVKTEIFSNKREYNFWMGVKIRRNGADSTLANLKVLHYLYLQKYSNFGVFPLMTFVRHLQSYLPPAGLQLHQNLLATPQPHHQRTRFFTQCLYLRMLLLQ